MVDRRTVPHDTRTQPVRALRLEVVQGPDQGAVHAARTDRVSIGTAPGNDLVLTDTTVSRHHVELRAEGDLVVVEDHGSTNGTVVGGVHVRAGALPAGSVLRLGRTKIRVDDGDGIEIPLHPVPELHGLVGSTPEMRRLMAQIDQIARSDASVLVLGETGTGKEVIARAIHAASPRSAAPLEIVDCGALMPTLVASELFGHEKGAFTGATERHLGAFERADGGTIFLDEIGELPAQLQIQLLGALERRAFKRVGGTKPISVDIRVVSATHRDLRKWVNLGEFRQDLYYRLAVARLFVPALRDRPADIPLLVEHFLRDLGYEEDLEEIMPASVLSTLQGYHWPGNVRELRNYIEAALAFGRPPALEGDAEVDPDKGAAVEGEALRIPEHSFLGRPYREGRDAVVDAFQMRYFADLLERTGGNVSQAANLARMSRPHMIQILKRHQLK